MNSVATSDRAINVPFHGSSLFIINHNGEPYTPMKPIVEGMGLAWQTQHRKLTERFKTCIIEMVMQLPGDSQRRSVVCIALRKLNGWLQTISPNKVRPEIRSKVIQYQEECDDVLYEYWTKGQVVNPRKAVKTLPGKITADQQEAIKQLVLTRGHALPKENQARAIITMWSSLKSHFGCSYKEISEDQFTEALSIAARVPLEGELIPTERKPVTLAAPGRYQLLQTIEANQVVESQLIGPKQFCATKDEFTSMMRWCGHVVALPEDLIKLTAVELTEYIQKCMARRREWMSSQNA
ncbi:TPA: phage antirepressor N-terminal domain-containing protein [Klebsiella pneumoniae]|nr:phage antirepressor N-terminal domain-containing protein [Klebsiella pneumoniae]HCD3712173.1 phage antirepressor N-terminal domain-containing protein [Klebsiella pneumoniae]HCD4732128.1 phage antirepressor N-terminal domain-containing protein [Klebsiella pneumoniae]HCD6823610.1 phage antirepressor N-terminal domain-containing protein [Klebsiella pneumoniae]HCH6762196.1 phage antirepressor N-terminal domain-containing protein [Klebsiella pneumoniae]